MNWCFLLRLYPAAITLPFTPLDYITLARVITLAILHPSNTHMHVTHAHFSTAPQKTNLIK